MKKCQKFFDNFAQKIFLTNGKKVRNNRFCFKINSIEKKSFQLPEIKLNLEVKSLINSSGLDCDLNGLLYCSFQRAISGNYPKYDRAKRQSFCSTSLPIASTRWVRLTISSLCPLL